VNRYFLALAIVVLTLLPMLAKADSAAVSCPSGLSVPMPEKGIALWPAGAVVQQMLQLSGKDLQTLLKNYPKLRKVNKIVIAEYAIPGPPAPAADILDFYLGTLRPPAWKAFYQSTKCDSTTASIAFKGNKGYISVLARPSCATVTYVNGEVALTAIPQLEQVLREALCCQEAEPVGARERMDSACRIALSGKTDEAITQLKAILVDYPTSAAVNFHIGRLFAEQHKNDEAGQSFRRAISLAPSNPAFRIEYARLLANSGDREKAEYELEQAVAFNPSSIQVHLTLAHVLEEMGKLKEAEGSFRKVIALGGGSAESYVDLARVLEKQGRKKEALDAYKEALKIKPGFSPAIEGTRRLEPQSDKPAKEGSK
jgi:predicted Zn-dependent protease